MTEHHVTYGDRALPVDFPVHQVLSPACAPALPDVDDAVRRALREPIGSPPLRERVTPDSKVALILDDSTRLFGQARMAELCLEELSHVRGENVTAVIAYGNHFTEPESVLDLPANLPEGARIWHHEYARKDMNQRVGVVKSRHRGAFFRYSLRDTLTYLADAPAHAARLLKAVMIGGPLAMLQRVGSGLPGLWVKLAIAGGDTAAEIATPAARADLIVAVGQVKPHFFAGYGGAAKSVVPGVASMKTIGANHFMMRHESARVGIVDDNICRRNLEEAVALGPPVFTVNVVLNTEKKTAAVTAGDMIEAHRAAVAEARKSYRVPGRKTGIVIAGAGFPEALELYQLTKVIIPPAAFVKPGGVVIVAGPCPRGLGRVGIVNEVIWELLVRHILPRRTKVVLVTDVPRRKMAATPFIGVSSLDDAMRLARRHAGDDAEVTLLKHAALIDPK